MSTSSTSTWPSMPVRPILPPADRSVLETGSERRVPDVSETMQEQSPDNEERVREEGRPDPEELLRRYGLRDRDLAAAPPPAVAPQGSTLARPEPAVGASTERYPHRRGRLRVYLAAV